MAVVDMLTLQKAREKERKKEKRKARRRLLESREHMCWNVVQTCDKCFIPIMPGMMYMREVRATFWGVRVSKYHSPICPEDPNRLRDEEDERIEVEFASQNKAA
jgi:hypothetical protein